MTKQTTAHGIGGPATSNHLVMLMIEMLQALKGAWLPQPSLLLQEFKHKLNCSGILSSRNKFCLGGPDLRSNSCLGGLDLRSVQITRIVLAREKEPIIPVQRVPNLVTFLLERGLPV